MWKVFRGALHWGSRSAGEEKALLGGSAPHDHVTLDDSRALQRNSSIQFVGSHNLTSSAKAGC